MEHTYTDAEATSLCEDLAAKSRVIPFVTNVTLLTNDTASIIWESLNCNFRYSITHYISQQCGNALVRYLSPSKWPSYEMRGG
jgi:hypothetical protein